jgi:hypothetical protein
MRIRNLQHLAAGMRCMQPLPGPYSFRHPRNPLPLLLPACPRHRYYYGDRGRCACCRQALPSAGALHWCSGCSAAAYCSEACMRRHVPDHGEHCHLCQELSAVLSIDFDRCAEPGSRFETFVLMAVALLPGGSAREIRTSPPFPYCRALFSG